MSVDFEPMHPGFESRESHNFFFMFFFVICHSAFFLSFVTVQIQHYCIYSDSPSLLSLVMPRPPAPSAL